MRLDAGQLQFSGEPERCRYKAQVLTQLAGWMAETGQGARDEITGEDSMWQEEGGGRNHRLRFHAAGREGKGDEITDQDSHLYEGGQFVCVCSGCRARQRAK